ncbi:DNA polymerase III subunit gamma/tau [Bifidobacterium pullorum subsp. saeculare]|uniref:DNA polymerase III subunit gamma/tau n=1 Tax=Bifidobacterium pullorum TaxID=78448 RepID=UPI00195A0E48|nr:DNA polymerase III subunit gamma/tau [Bifidobacterium pullorum]MBM6705536.1 DNA polymerase III subunit gamma/tau [Bifidobacterium pullorum subsp. saeculare]
MALALYRRYRPDTFDGVIGQDQVTVPLMRALDQGKLTHAYLFSGPRGCGKTSSARILARCVNCAQGPTSHPCGECESCKDLATGGPGSIDVVEIDAASHNGVDDARELRERAGFAPARDRYKIFILDEAHMVTPQGFNALLKIVEEPPEHVMFIFATTEPEKVIGTIRSRTHHYPFRLVPQEVMGPYLERICEQEGIRPEPGVLKLAMRAGGGSMRDTLSVLDQLMVGAVDGAIPYDSAVALLGFTPEGLIGEAIDAVIAKDGEALYGVVQKVVIGGFDPRRFVEDLLARVRDLLVLTLGGERAEHVLGDDAASDMDGLHRQAAALSLPELTAMAEMINTTLGSMSGATSPRMRLELLAARLLAGREQGFVPAASAAPQSSGSAEAAGQTASQPTPHVGFVGAARNRKPQPASVPSASTASPQEGAATAAQRPVAGASSDAVAGHQGPAGTSQPAAQPAAEQPRQPDARTPEQKWEAVLAALPEEIREYVDHGKVPTVSYAVDASGKGRLSMTFDSALSQHAFSLAVATDAEHGGKKAANVVLDEVRRTFGAHTMIAPTGVAANGEHVVPIKRLSPEQVKQVKTQILMAKAEAAAASTAAMTAGRAAAEPGSHAAHDGEEPSESDEPGHRGTPSHPVASSSFGVGLEDDDPWMTPITPVPPMSSPHKHVAVPDLSDDDDPWAHPLPAPQAPDAVPDGGVSQASPALRQTSQPAAASQPAAGHERHFLAGAASDATADDPWPAVPAAGGFDAHAAETAGPGEPSGPQVDPDEDEYSLSDESLGTAAALSVEELSKIFEVKKVEKFAADDPKNPRNAQPPKHGMG